MRKLVTSAHQKLFEQSIQQLLKDLGTTMTLYMQPNVTRCPNCLWDDVNKAATNTFNAKFISPVVIYGVTYTPTPFGRALHCPICKGLGNIEQQITKTIPYMTENTITIRQGLATTDYSEIGLIEAGEVIVKTLAQYWPDLEKCKYIMKENIKYSKKVAVNEGLKAPIVCVCVLKRER